MSKDTGIDVIQATGDGFSGAGVVAQKLMQNNFNVNALRTQDVLRKDEWKLFDKAIIDVARTRLVAVGDLVTRGLTFPVANALGVTKIEWEQASDLTDAEISMGGITDAQRDRQTFALKSVPLPIIHKEFQINIRALTASRNLGQPLDVTQAAVASRIVSERIETLLFNGSSIAGTNNLIYGYKTHPDRITGTLGTSWATDTGANIMVDVLAMIGGANAKNQYGPFIIYVSVAAMVNLANDFKAESDKTILARIREVPGIADVKASSDVLDTEVLMVQMSQDTVDMVEGLQPTMVSWESHGGFMLNFKVLAIMVPRIKSDKAGQSGVTHYS